RTRGPAPIPGAGGRAAVAGDFAGVFSGVVAGDPAGCLSEAGVADDPTGFASRAVEPAEAGDWPAKADVRTRTWSQATAIPPHLRITRHRQRILPLHLIASPAARQPTAPRTARPLRSAPGAAWSRRTSRAAGTGCGSPRPRGEFARPHPGVLTQSPAALR